MTTYVLGAGASFHAGYPLAYQLGEDLYAWARGCDQPGIQPWLGYMESLREKYRALTDLERILTELVDCPAGSIANGLSRITRGNTLGAIRTLIPEMFYSLSLKPIHSDLYAELARTRIKAGDAIITFNYDLACEHALKRAGLWEISDGYGFDIGVQQIPRSKSNILKLHGSTNWVGILFDGNMGIGQASSVYDSRPAVFGSRNFLYLGYPTDIQDPLCKGISRCGGQPAVILPALHKKFFHETFAGQEWRPFWDHIWGKAADALRCADRIILIGYSMPKADERARELLLRQGNREAEIQVFSGSNTAAIEEEFEGSGFRNVVHGKNGMQRFEDFLRSPVAN